MRGAQPNCAEELRAPTNCARRGIVYRRHHRDEHERLRVEERLARRARDEERARDLLDRLVVLAARAVRAVDEAEQHEERGVDRARRAEDRADGERREVAHQAERKEDEHSERADQQVRVTQHGRQRWPVASATEPQSIFCN